MKPYPRFTLVPTLRGGRMPALWIRRLSGKVAALWRMGRSSQWLHRSNSPDLRLSGDPFDDDGLRRVTQGYGRQETAVAAPTVGTMPKTRARSGEPERSGSLWQGNRSRKPGSQPFKLLKGGQPDIGHTPTAKTHRGGRRGGPFTTDPQSAAEAERVRSLPPQLCGQVLKGLAGGLSAADPSTPVRSSGERSTGKTARPALDTLFHRSQKPAAPERAALVSVPSQGGPPETHGLCGYLIQKVRTLLNTKVHQGRFSTNTANRLTNHESGKPPVGQEFWEQGKALPAQWASSLWGPQLQNVPFVGRFMTDLPGTLAPSTLNRGGPAPDSGFEASREPGISTGKVPQTAPSTREVPESPLPSMADLFQSAESAKGNNVGTSGERVPPETSFPRLNPTAGSPAPHPFSRAEPVLGGEQDLSDLADKLKRILEEDARRHGYNV